MAAVSADGSTVCVLIRRLNSSCNRSIAFVVRTLRHWLGGRRAKVKSRSPACSRLSAAARWLCLLSRRRLDHVVVIRGDLTIQALRGMPEKVHVLMNRPALHRLPARDCAD